MLTPNEHREANGFTWEPITEVAILFGGIFACIIPVLAMLQAGPAAAFSWLLAAAHRRRRPERCGLFLAHRRALRVPRQRADLSGVLRARRWRPDALMGPLASTLVAISMGAAYMGALTYIGNAPNLMIYAIAVERGVKMPSFFGFILWSVRGAAAGVRAHHFPFRDAVALAMRTRPPRYSRQQT